ncbi:hypothetical protein [Rudanella lutea]|uniref:hypothetical protein n=1 Tax=Rudanella lutea TaxID=451374 RepID=UPI000368EDB0|nr:hypothetical protein [Rudanella lutea]
MNNRLGVITTLSISLFALFFSARPSGDILTLQPESLGFTPATYYIATVTDARPTPGFGRWFTAAGQPATSVDLPGGTAAGIGQFIRQNLKQNKSTRAVAMRLRECKVVETAQGNRISGTLNFAVTFELLRNADGEAIPVKLNEFRTKGQYTRPASQTQVVEQSLRQSVVASLRAFDAYIKKEGLSDSRLATRINLVLQDYVRNRDNDTVFYSLDRPLTWADFQAPPRTASRYAAEINPNFAYEGRSKVVNGTVELTLTMKTFMLKSSSWVKPPALNAYSLNHEQRHFDIARIITERFKSKLHPDSLSIEDYNSNIQYQFLESYREMSRLQELYDSETNHGLNVAAQERWNARIDADLKMYGIKK